MDGENTPQQPSRRSPFTWIPAVVVAALLAATGFFVSLRYEPPPVVPAGAPGNIFSAERAFERLQRLLAHGQPHPLGSPANRRFRARLLRELEGLGLDPEENDHWVSAGRGSTTTLALARNLMAELPSSNPDLPALLLSCHYDSVPAGPGASDDGAAVATLLEVAGILMKEAPLPRPVILLFTDGEELGLDGALGFSRFNEAAERIGMIMNFEARGSSGGSLMFETSKGNSWMIDQMAHGLHRPMSSSAYVTVYRRMPNSSDLTVFMRRGLDGINFAFIGRPKHYHTPLDNLENLNRRSLQHHGDNALGMVRQLLTSDWQDANSEEDAVYTDIAARFILAWPSNWGPWFAGAVLLALLLPFLRLCRDHRWGVLELSRGISCWILCTLVGVVTGWFASWTLQRIDPPPTPWPAHMYLDLLVPCICTAMGLLLTIRFVRPRPTLFFFLHGLTLALGALILSLVAEGFSYLFLIPAFTAALTSLLLLNSRRENSFLLTISCLLLGLTTTVLIVPFLKYLPDALGIMISPPVMSALVALLLLPLVPLLAPLSRKFLLRCILLLGLGALGTGYLTLQTPAFTADLPQQLNLTYYEEMDQGTGQISFVSQEGSLPPLLTSGLKHLPEPGNLAYPLRGSAFETRKADLPLPKLELLNWNNENDAHSARIRFTPALPSQEIVIGLDQAQELSTISALGTDLPLPQTDRSNRQWLRFRGVPNDGLEIVLTWKKSPTLRFSLVGSTPGLPPHLDELRTIRDQLPACAAHSGDRSIVLRNVLLESPVF